MYTLKYIHSSFISRLLKSYLKAVCLGHRSLRKTLTCCCPWSKGHQCSHFAKRYDTTLTVPSSLTTTPTKKLITMVQDMSYSTVSTWVEWIFWYPLLDALMCVFVHFRSHHDVCDFVPNSVIDSWEVVRRISGYEEKVGTKLFQK